MQKPASLRAVLEQFVPALKADPTKLAIFIDEGRIAATAGSLSFEYRYTLNIVVEDYAGDEDALIVPILAWIGANQPDLLQRQDQTPFRFRSELLEEGAADYSIYIDLDEPVSVVPLDGGGFDTTRPDTPGDLDSFGIGCQPLWQLFLDGQLAAQSSDPRFTGQP